MTGTFLTLVIVVCTCKIHQTYCTPYVFLVAIISNTEQFNSS